MSLVPVIDVTPTGGLLHLLPIKKTGIKKKKSFERDNARSARCVPRAEICSQIELSLNYVYKLPFKFSSYLFSFYQS